jgi:hypothetical protein
VDPNSNPYYAIDDEWGSSFVTAYGDPNPSILLMFPYPTDIYSFAVRPDDWGNYPQSSPSNSQLKLTFTDAQAGVHLRCLRSATLRINSGSGRDAISPRPPSPRPRALEASCSSSPVAGSASPAARSHFAHLAPRCSTSPFNCSPL